MIRPVRLHLTATLALCALFVFLEGENAAFGKKSGANPQDGSNLPNASAVVKPRSYVSLEPVPRGSQFQVAVVVDIARGFHMNSHKPSDAYLIPTTLTPQLPAGIRLDDAVYPEGRSEKFSFSPTNRSTYIQAPSHFGSAFLQARLRRLAQLHCR